MVYWIIIICMCDFVLLLGDFSFLVYVVILAEYLKFVCLEISEKQAAEKHNPDTSIICLVG